MTDQFTTPIDLTIKSRWKQLTHTLPPDSPPLWQHMDDTRYFSGDGGETNFKIEISKCEIIDEYHNPAFEKTNE